MTLQEKVVKTVLDGKVTETEMEIVLNAMKVSFLDGKLAERKENELEKFYAVVPAIDYD